MINRKSLNEIETMSHEEFFDTDFIGEDTPEELWKHIVNLGDCFNDTEHSISNKQFGKLKIINDIGLEYRKNSDSSGSDFGTGDYRLLSIEDSDGNNPVIGFSVLFTGRTNDDPKYGNQKGKSVLAVLFQDSKISYNVLQLNLNVFLKFESGKLILWHNGVVKKKGARKDELIRRVKEKYPSLVRNGEIYFGTLPTDKLMYMDSEEVANTLCNLILYSLIRNEYKLSLKNNKK